LVSHFWLQAIELNYNWCGEGTCLVELEGRVSMRAEHLNERGLGSGDQAGAEMI
jgi:hypothetical protein